MPAIVTIASNLPKWGDITIPRMRHYAERIGATLSIVEPESYSGFMDRSLIFMDALEKHGRCAFIDADCVIARNAPDIFETHREGCVWMVQDAPEGMDGSVCRYQDMIFVQAVRSGIGWVKGYGNMGVVVCDKMHIFAFQNWIDVPGTHHDQAQFNYMVEWLRLDRGWMNPAWNKTGLVSGRPNKLEFAKEIANGAFIAHAAGFNQFHAQGETKEDGERRRLKAIEIFDSILP